MVALESTLIAHGLPRPENLQIARGIEDAVREEGAVPATIAIVDGMVRIGLDDAAMEAIAAGEDVAKCSARDLPVVMARRATGRDDRRRHRDARRARGDRRVRHRRARRRAPRRARHLGRVGRPHDARPDADHGRLRGRQVDPRRGGDARAARDPQRHAAGLPHRPLPRLLPGGLRLPGALAGGQRRRRSPTSSTRAPSWAWARSSSPTRSTTRSTPSCTSGCWPAASRPPRATASAART